MIGHANEHAHMRHSMERVWSLRSFDHNQAAVGETSTQQQQQQQKNIYSRKKNKKQSEVQHQHPFTLDKKET